MNNTPRPDRKVSLVVGLLLLGLGAVFLLATHKMTDLLLGWWPVIPLVLGVFLLYVASRRVRAPRYFFSGTLLTLSSLFTLLIFFFFPTWNLGLKELWPIYVALVGLSLLPYAIFSKPRFRLKLMIPGIFLIFLGFVFLLFSLSIIEQTFAEFVFSWWPLILIFTGITLTLSYFFGGSSLESQAPDDLEEDEGDE